MEIVVDFAVLVVFTETWMDFELSIMGNRDVAKVEQPMDVGAQQQPVARKVFATSGP
jgi:hypothetical protein